ncbi:hypothetical protein CH063_12103 [Colletotrichum higginsianum]|uniref:Uncharacterized protein n=1 Tax=Colletotrichum higginsianum (strain IMI 349063) TaxID=759273 RepID=H1VP32_COLHI|nr:hypothetical protein CH063_12103 [Colletotrichum higginsianum]
MRQSVCLCMCVCVCPYTQRPTMNESKFPSGHSRHESPVPLVPPRPSSSFGRFQTAHYRESKIPPIVLIVHTTVGCHPCQELACEAPCLTPLPLEDKTDVASLHGSIINPSRAAVSPREHVKCPKLPDAMNQQFCVPRRRVRRSETDRERERDYVESRTHELISGLMLFPIANDDLP